MNSDSPGSDAMKTRAEPGNPEARHLKLTTDNCLGETPLLSVVNSISDPLLTLSDEGSWGQFIDSLHLFVFTSVICRAVRGGKGCFEMHSISVC